MKYATTLASLAAVAVAAPAIQQFQLQFRGFDPAINNTFVSLANVANEEYYAVSGSQPNGAFYLNNGQLFFNDYSARVSWGADFVTSKDKLVVLELGAYREPGTNHFQEGFGFDGEGRLSLYDNQWGWFACSGLGESQVSGKHGIAYYANQADADKRCEPVTLQRV